MLTLLFNAFLQQALCMLRHIRPSVRHTLVLCQNERMQKDAVFIVG